VCARGHRDRAEELKVKSEEFTGTKEDGAKWVLKWKQEKPHRRVAIVNGPTAITDTGPEPPPAGAPVWKYVIHYEEPTSD
jgi:hypothetical protein